MSKAIELLSSSPARTQAIGRALGGTLRGGDLIALNGPLGSGKTQLVKGLASGLEVPEDEPVVSPTFVLIREYVGRLKLYHLDAYRLHGAAELWALGLEEMCADRGGVVALEWADRVAQAVGPDAISIELEHVGGSERRLTVRLADQQRAAEFARLLAVQS